MTEDERQERIYHHMYETCEGIREQSERIVALEELVGDLYPAIVQLCETLPSCTTCPMLRDERCWFVVVYDCIKELEVPL